MSIICAAAGYGASRFPGRVLPGRVPTSRARRDERLALKAHPARAERWAKPIRHDCSGEVVKEAAGHRSMSHLLRGKAWLNCSTRPGNRSGLIHFVWTRLNLRPLRAFHATRPCKSRLATEDHFSCDCDQPHDAVVHASRAPAKTIRGRIP
jgi:hypothetical protein